MPTLFLSHRYHADSYSLRSAAEAAGWEVIRLHSYAVSEELRGVGGVFYGEDLVADAVRGPLGLNLLEPDHAWLPSLPYAHRLRDVHLTTLAVAAQDTRRRFVKPADEKQFAADVYESGATLSEHVDGSTPVLSAEPVHFEIEFRAFVLGREVASLSPYIRGGALAHHASEDEWIGAREALGKLLADRSVMVPPGVVVDVGLIEGRGWAVVEANPAWGSGLCHCDPAEVLPVLAAACPAEVVPEHQRWLRTLHV